MLPKTKTQASSRGSDTVSPCSLPEKDPFVRLGTHYQLACRPAETECRTDSRMSSDKRGSVLYKA